MELGDGCHDVPPGKVAMVVTHLEMRQRPVMRARDLPEAVAARRVETPDLAWYRDLLYRVGSEWLWFYRLSLAEDRLAAILAEPAREVWTLEAEDRAEGILELDFAGEDDCEIAFFGLTRRLMGTGAGRWLMSHGIDRAFDRPVSRLHLHTCTLDSPQALGFYRAAGFVPTRQQVEIADDPRLAGTLPMDAAPQVPVFRAG